MIKCVSLQNNLDIATVSDTFIRLSHINVHFFKEDSETNPFKTVEALPCLSLVGCFTMYIKAQILSYHG